MGAYYLYDVKADTMTKLADLAPWIEEQQMAEMTPVTYTSRDGLEIEGYLTLPVGKTLHNAKNLPVVVNPHGGRGPATRGDSTPRCSSSPTAVTPYCR